MAKTKISEYSSSTSSNTDINNINIDEGCSPSGINNAIRTMMGHLKDFISGSSGDSLTVGGNLSVTGTTTLTGDSTTITQAPTDNSTKLATTAYVKTNLSSLSLGTISTQNANSVAITGGTIAGATITGGTVSSLSSPVSVNSGGTGAASFTSGSVLLGNGTGAVSSLTPSNAGDTVFSTDGTTWTSQPKLYLATAQATTSGSTIDFTGIPSWAKRISVVFSGVSTNGSTQVVIQLGTSSGFVVTGYSSNTFSYNSGTATSSTTGFVIDQGASSGGSVSARNGIITISLVGSGQWAASGVLVTGNITPSAGNLIMSGVVDRLRIKPETGTNVFDAGLVSITYE